MKKSANTDSGKIVNILNDLSQQLAQYKENPRPDNLTDPTLIAIKDSLKDLANAIPHLDMNVQWCKGVGGAPNPESFWLGFFPKGQTASKGIYTAICFERGGDRICVGCCRSGNGEPKIPAPILEKYPQGLSSKGEIYIKDGYYRNYFTNETEVFERGEDGWTTDVTEQIIERVNESSKAANKIIELIEAENRWMHGDSAHNTEQKSQDDNLGSRLPLNQILYGPPGTGKTRNAVIRAVEIADGRVSTDEYNKVLKRFNELKEAKRIEFTTFHQSYGYEDFIEGIQPKLEGDDLRYELRDGIFKRFCNVARNAPKDNYVFIIDEINRGNIAKIFGELITLIEPSRRAGAEEEMTAVLPYSQKSFSVPNNVYVLGTMNTADRSIALLDTALRRRFSFVEMMPETEVLNDNVDGIDLKRLLATINRRIAFLLDREHQIGHSYFIGIRSITDLTKVFKNDVIPLLQEYFFDNYENIRLVIGDFVRENKTDYTVQTLFDNKPLDGIDSEKKVYELNEEAFARKESYTSIYQVQK